MNTEDRIKELYTGVFDEIHASDKLLRKVNNMTETTKKRSIRAAVKVAYVAAAAAVLLIAGNIVAYASTGEMLLKVLINGEEQTVSATQEEDGSYSFTCSDEDGTSYNVLVEGDISDNTSDVGDYKLNETIPELVKDGNKTYLTLDDDFKVDITDNFKEDGTAEGEFERDGAKYSYIVDADGEIWLSCVDEEAMSEEGLEFNTVFSDDSGEAKLEIFDEK